MSLYDLPRELLVKIITTVPHEQKNEDRMMRALCKNFVTKHVCCGSGCQEYCMSMLHPSCDDDICIYRRREAESLRFQFDVDNIRFFAFPRHNKIFKNFEVMAIPDDEDSENMKKKNECGVLYCGKW